MAVAPDRMVEIIDQVTERLVMANEDGTLHDPTML